MSNHSIDSKERSFSVYAIICASGWIGTSLFIFFKSLESPSDWPADFPGPSPSIMPWVALGFVLIGIIIMFYFVNQIKNWPAQMEPTKYYDQPSGLTGVTGLGGSRPIESGYSDRSTLRIPEICSKCKYVLPTEGLDWMGPLEFRCPRCGAVQHAKKEEWYS